MADKSQMQVRRKEKKDKEAAEVTKEVKAVKKEEESAENNGEAGAAAENGDVQVEPMELPPFEIITG